MADGNLPGSAVTVVAPGGRLAYTICATARRGRAMVLSEHRNGDEPQAEESAAAAERQGRH